MTGQFFFVFAQLLFDFLDRSIQGSNNRAGFGRGYEVVAMFSRYIDFDVRLFLMLKIDSDFDRVDTVKKSTHFFGFLADYFLIVAAERAVASGDIDLHLVGLHVVRVRIGSEQASANPAPIPPPGWYVGVE